MADAADVDGDPRVDAPTTDAGARGADGPLVSEQPPDAPGLPRWTPIVVGLVEPVYVGAPPGDPRLFILEKRGRVLVRTPDGELHKALDIQDRLIDESDLGLLGLAFHPRFADNGLVFLHYSSAPARRGRISEFDLRGPTPETSERVVLETSFPFDWWHRGGSIAFGLDGLLYIGFGDGGGTGDPGNHAQDPGSWLGKILRIDVDRRGGDRAYGIPPENPFVDWDDEVRCGHIG